MQTRRDSPRGTLSSIFLSVILCLSTNAQIENSGFENDWDGWNRTDPSAISSDAHSGSKAAKITGPGGRLEQSVSLEADSKYELSAWVEGAGVIGIEGGPSTKTSGDGYRKYVVPFTTDNSGAVTIYGVHGGSDDVRFDDIEVTAPGGKPLAPKPSAPSNSPTPAPPSPSNSSASNTKGGKFASDIVDLTPWKLNIPFDSSGNDSGEVSSWDDRNKNSHEVSKLDQYEFKKDGTTYFGVNGDGSAAIFRAHTSGATTDGSKYPRCELRQLMDINGSWEDTYWPGTKYQKMYLIGRINAVPSVKPETVIAQIHAKNDKADDTLKIGYDHDEKVIFITYVDSNYDEHVTHPLQPSTYSKPGDPNPDVQRLDYTLGDELEITIENKRPNRPDYEVFVQVNNLSTGKGVTLTYTQGKDHDGYYFKAGCYTQSHLLKDDMFLYPLRSGAKEGASAYAETEISVLKVIANP